jgi:6-pyruvoyltetrahydropterin/6-carboxytetrahydropterin synthase
MADGASKQKNWRDSWKEERIMGTSVTKIFSFDAAHRLPNYDGPCANIHGHTYKLEVTVVNGTGLTELGMVIDFALLKKIVHEAVISTHDHTYLNDLYILPTAEIMAREIFFKIDEALNLPGVAMRRVRLWETPDSYAEVER